MILCLLIRLTQLEQQRIQQIQYSRTRLTQVEQLHFLLIQQLLKPQRKVEAPRQRLLPQQHITLVVLQIHQEVPQNQEVQQRHLIHKQRITHHVLPQQIVVVVVVLEVVNKNKNM